MSRTRRFGSRTREAVRPAEPEVTAPATVPDVPAAAGDADTDPSTVLVEDTSAGTPTEGPSSDPLTDPLAHAVEAWAGDTEAPAVEPQAADELDPDHTPYWDVWAGPIGHTIRPILEEVETSVPTLTAAIALTPAGRAICSIGLDEAESVRAAAMVSNMIALGGSATALSTGHEPETSEAEILTLTQGDQRAVALVVSDLIVDRIVLWLTATEVNLGVLTFQAKSVGDRISQVLANQDDPQASHTA